MNSFIRTLERTKSTNIIRLIARGAIHAFIAQIVGAFLGYFSQIVLARILGTTAFGGYSTIVANVELAGTLVTLGLGTTALKLIPEYLAKEAYKLYNGLIWRGRQLIIAATIILAFISVLAISAVPDISVAGRTRTNLILFVFLTGMTGLSRFHV